MAKTQRPAVQLRKFARLVLARLEADEEWDSDTIDHIGCLAIQLDLGHTDSQRRFRAGPRPLHKGPRKTARKAA